MELNWNPRPYLRPIEKASVGMFRLESSTWISSRVFETEIDTMFWGEKDFDNPLSKPLETKCYSISYSTSLAIVERAMNGCKVQRKIPRYNISSQSVCTPGRKWPRNNCPLTLEILIMKIVCAAFDGHCFFSLHCMWCIVKWTSGDMIYLWLLKLSLLPMRNVCFS